MFPILNPPPSSLPIPSLWVVPVHQPQASSIVHRTWTGNSFHIWYYTYFNLCLCLLLPPYPSIVIYCFRFTLLDRRGSFEDLYLTFPKYDSSYSTGQEQYMKITPKYIIGVEETWCCFKSSGISVNSHLYLIVLKIYGYSLYLCTVIQISASESLWEKEVKGVSTIYTWYGVAGCFFMRPS